MEATKWFESPSDDVGRPATVLLTNVYGRAQHVPRPEVAGQALHVSIGILPSVSPVFLQSHLPAN